MTVRIVALIGLGGETASQLEAAVRAIEAGVPAVRHSHLGEHLPGSIGGGDFTWDVLLDDSDPRVVLEAEQLTGLRQRGALEQIDAVAFRVENCVVQEPGLRDGVKRTLFFRVREGAQAEPLREFERAVLAMPEHIGAIRNYALHRADSDLCATAWTHVWEQEFLDASGLEVDYMTHPYHWGVVDGWFDAESPRCLVEPRLAHVYCRTPTSILAWT